MMCINDIGGIIKDGKFTSQNEYTSGGENDMDLKSRAKNIKSDLPAVFLALKDKDTPVLAKIFAWLTVAYALSPVDLVPDFIPLLGYLDDIIILPLLIALTIRFIPEDMIQKYRKQADGMWENGKPKKWYYAFPIILIWIFVIFIIWNVMM